MSTIRQRDQRPADGSSPRVVVVGAGFGGVAAIRRLARAGVQTTLIDRNIYATFQPLLYQVATAGLASSDVAYPARAAVRRYGAVFRHGELARIDSAAKQIILADGGAIDYDYLILATGVAAAYHGVPGAVHVSLLDRGPALLGPFHPALRDYALRQLVRRGVEVRLGTAIAEITADKVLLADGGALASDITVWAAGVAAPDEVTGWGLPQARGGRIRTGPDLRVAGEERIFAVGDVGLIDDQPLPQLAQPALQTGRHAADQIRRLEGGRPTAAFRYRDKGIMATIGYRSAVVQLPHRLHVGGTPAWMAWLALHLTACSAAATGRPRWSACPPATSPGGAAAASSSARPRPGSQDDPTCGHAGAAPCGGRSPERRGRHHPRGLGGGRLRRAGHAASRVAGDPARGARMGRRGGRCAVPFDGRVRAAPAPAAPGRRG